MKKIIDYLTPRPAIFFLLAALLWGLIMLFLSLQAGVQVNDIIIEADGMVFDLLIFGALLAWYDGKRQKNERIEQELNLIEDLRGWKNEEGVFRTVGAIKRLENAGISEIDLYGCFLKNALLVSLNLEGSNLQQANLQNAKLQWTTLYGAALDGADFQQASLNKGNIENATLEGTNLSGASLDELMVGMSWFEKLEKWKVIGREEITEKYLIDETGRLQLK